MLDASQVDLAGLDQLDGLLDRAIHLDYTELMIRGASILQEDNATYLLEGLDCDGRPMPPTWRERNPEGYWFTRGTGPSRRRIHAKGGQEAGMGPPLVPHGAASRAIADTQVGWTTAAPWQSFLSWTGFDTDDGRSVLSLHAHPGSGAPYSKRDIIGHPRPATVARFTEDLLTFVRTSLGI